MKVLKSPDGNLVEMTLTLVHQTQGAMLLSDGNVKEWVPKSMMDDYEPIGNNEYTIVIPEWMAIEKGFV